MNMKQIGVSLGRVLECEIAIAGRPVVRNALWQTSQLALIITSGASETREVLVKCKSTAQRGQPPAISVLPHVKNSFV